MKLNGLKTLSRVVMALVLVQALTISKTWAQDEDDFSFSVSLNSDQFFGFYPFFQGAYSLSETADFTFYGILWSGGTGGAWGNWTEFGVGVNLTPAEGLSINPQIGILGGNLLSGGAAGPAVLGDGIVPNLTVTLDNQVEGQLYVGFYAPARDEAPPAAQGGTTLSYLHYWINGGYKISGAISAGLHYEQLTNSGGSEVTESTDVYQWFGPYIQFADPSGGPFARFTFGTDFVDGNDSFFKLSTGFSF